MHSLWAKSNNRTRGQFECDVIWFCFCFEFVRSHSRCGCCSIVCWRGCVCVLCVCVYVCVSVCKCVCVCGGGVHSTLWKLSLHIAYIFTKAWNFSTKFWYSNQIFSRNILTSLCSKSKTSANAQFVIILLYILLLKAISWHGISWKLTLRIPLDKWGHKITLWIRSRGFSWNLLQCLQLLSKMSTFTQAINLTFGRSKFGKRTVQNLWTGIHFYKKSSD